MATKAPHAAPAKIPGIEVGQITNFSGGPNFRDSPTELAATEVYSAYNTTFDERGGVQSRLGYQKRNLLALASTSYAQTVLFYRPSLYWRLGELSGTDAADASGNGNDGTYGAGCTLGQSGAPINDTNTAVSFNNTTSAVVSSLYQPFVSGSGRTFMGWANRTATTDSDYLFIADSGGTTAVSLALGTGNENVAFQIAASAVQWLATWPGTAQWVHWALTYDDTTGNAELFINGTSQGVETVPQTYLANGWLILGQPFGTTQSWNGTMDEVAVFETILSTPEIQAIYASRLVAPGSTPLVVNDYYSPLLGGFLTQSGTNLFFADSTTPVHTFSTNGCVTFAELGGKVIVGHPSDGLWYSTNGSTWTQITSANAPTTAVCICTWLAKLFVGLADGTVHWSNASDPLTWTVTDFNAIWTKDQKPIVALHIGSGQDIQGRPGLLAFKQESVYRINDSGTGAYTVLDTSHGAGGPKAVIGVGARVIWIGKGGIWWWREDQASPVNGSDLLRPIWNTSELSFNNQNGWAAGRRLNRAYFSASSLNSQANDLAFEYHPDEEWVTVRSDAMTCYSVDDDEQTYGGSPTVVGQVYQLASGGTDDGASITGWFQTRWLVPNGGFQAQVWQARLHGRGSGTMTMRQDYEDAGGSTRLFDFATGGYLYDNGVLYDSGATYSTVTLAETEAFSGFPVCRQFGLRFDFTADTTVAGRTLFGNTPQPQVGEFALYGIETLYVPLGSS